MAEEKNRRSKKKKNLYSIKTLHLKLEKMKDTLVKIISIMCNKKEKQKKNEMFFPCIKIKKKQLKNQINNRLMKRFHMYSSIIRLIAQNRDKYRGKQNVERTSNIERRRRIKERRN